ncbi:hypothetical protein KAR02_02475 [Candidatus Bipolaricaulota bacterium]|nr:hypothetical protein [Candidatus Bipolaricaulota bacterium]
MSLPKTPLMVAPDENGPESLLGRCMPSSDLVRTLIEVNRNIFCPDINDANHIESWHGVTSLWLGDPGGGGKPICGIKLGTVPEWTRIDDKGVMISKGWRAIFEKVIRARAATRAQIEKAFKVSLAPATAPSTLCGVCVREGRREKHNGGARKMCDMHDGAYAAVESAMRTAPERLDKALWKKEKIIVS